MLELLAQRPGIDVHWVVLGAEGVRRGEAEASATAFLRDAGSSRILIEGFRDSFFPFVGTEIKQRLHELAEGVSPDLILTHRRADLHQDHRLVAELTWCAFRDHLILEYEIPKYDGDLGQPNLFVPLSRAACEGKVERIAAGFPSQRDKPWFSDDTFWSLLRIRGVECHSPTRFAEGFHCHKLKLGV